VTVKITHVSSPESFAGSDHRRRPPRAHGRVLPGAGCVPPASGCVPPGAGSSGRVGLVRRLEDLAGSDQPDTLHRPLTGGR